MQFFTNNIFKRLFAEDKILIKGCSKRVIVMKETGNDMIEEAFFVIRPQGAKKNFTDADIMTQAKNILEKSDAQHRFSSINTADTVCAKSSVKRKNNKKDALFFALGLVFGAFLGVAFTMVIAV